MLGQRGNILPLRDWGSARHPGDDHSLTDARQGILPLYRGSCPTETGHTRCQRVRNPPFFQRIHLFLDRPIEAGVPRMQTHRLFLFPLRLFHGGKHLLQGHLRAVKDTALRRTQTQQHRIDQAAGINDHIRLLQPLRPPQGNQIGCSWPRAYKMNHAFTPSQEW